MGAQWSQFFPPKPTFKEADVEPQDGRVFLITGGNSGLGLELAKILYRRKGRVYITARTEEKGREAIKEIQAAAASSGEVGHLEFLVLNLDDLKSIKGTVEAFKAKETKLHVLFNNAAVSQPPLDNVSKQGFELQLATNCLGPFLLTQLLLPLLQTASAEASPGSVRVVWLGSHYVELAAPTHGIVMADVRNPPRDNPRNYTHSKAGNMFLASELARRVGSTHNIVSVSLNPGTAKTNLLRHSRLMRALAWPFAYPATLVVHTELYAGLSGDITLEQNGCYVIPFGRVSTNVRPDLLEAMRTPEDGGSGTALEFWEWCEEKTRDYM